MYPPKYCLPVRVQSDIKPQASFGQEKDISLVLADKYPSLTDLIELIVNVYYVCVCERERKCGQNNNGYLVICGIYLIGLKDDGGEFIMFINTVK